MNNIIFIIFLISSQIFPQMDNPRDYFPLHEGNIWQYRYRNNPGQTGWVENMISCGDTVMPGGLTYTQLFNPPYYGTGYIKYCRIDSHYNVLEYVDSLCSINNEPDTSGLHDPPNSFGCLVDTSISIFKLNVPDSTYWSTFFNIGDNLFLPSLRYMGEYETEIFGQQTRAKVFTQYSRQYYPGPGIWVEYYGWNYVFVKGIGIYSTGFGESSTATLEGAIINGIKYGTLVGIGDNTENKPKSFMLYQNYPNPFNPTTKIKFVIPNVADAFNASTTNVFLKVYDVLGNEIATLVDKHKPPGTYEIEFDARLPHRQGSNLPSGIYFYSITSGKFHDVKKMILMK